MRTLDSKNTIHSRRKTANALSRTFSVIIYRTFSSSTVLSPGEKCFGQETFTLCESCVLYTNSGISAVARKNLWATFWERRESEDTHEKSIFLLFRQTTGCTVLVSKGWRYMSNKFIAMFWRNERKIDFSWVSSDSRYSQKIALKHCAVYGSLTDE